MDYNKFIEDYLSRGLIKKQPVGFDQINSFIAQSKRELKDCNNILDISAKNRLFIGVYGNALCGAGVDVTCRISAGGS